MPIFQRNETEKIDDKLDSIYEIERIQKQIAINKQKEDALDKMIQNLKKELAETRDDMVRDFRSILKKKFEEELEKDFVKYLDIFEKLARYPSVLMSPEDLKIKLFRSDSTDNLAKTLWFLTELRPKWSINPECVNINIEDEKVQAQLKTSKIPPEKEINRMYLKSSIGGVISILVHNEKNDVWEAELPSLFSYDDNLWVIGINSDEMMPKLVLLKKIATEKEKDEAVEEVIREISAPSQ